MSSSPPNAAPTSMRTAAADRLTLSCMCGSCPCVMRKSITWHMSCASAGTIAFPSDSTLALASFLSLSGTEHARSRPSVNGWRKDLSDLWAHARQALRSAASLHSFSLHSFSVNDLNSRVSRELNACSSRFRARTRCSEAIAHSATPTHTNAAILLVAGVNDGMREQRLAPTWARARRGSDASYAPAGPEFISQQLVIFQRAQVVLLGDDRSGRCSRVPGPAPTVMCVSAGRGPDA